MAAFKADDVDMAMTCWFDTQLGKTAYGDGSFVDLKDRELVVCAKSAVAGCAHDICNSISANGDVPAHALRLTRHRLAVKKLSFTTGDRSFLCAAVKPAI